MKSRILFVDDELAVLKGLERALRSQREVWDMAFADSGARALQMLRHGDFDAIVTDMCMPDMDGIGLLESVVAEYPHMIRIVLSGHSDRGLVVKSALLAHQYLNKPCSVKLLKATLERVFRQGELVDNEALRKAVNGLSCIPTLRSSFEAMIAAMDSPDPSLRDIGQVIGRDPSLAVKLMQLAGTGFFNTGRQVTSCVEAVGLIGLDNLRELVFSVGIFCRLEGGRDGDGSLAEEVLSKGVEVGQLARRIALYEGCGEDFAQACFLSGLWHDIGILALEKSLPGGYARVKSRAQSQPMDLWRTEQELLGTSHAAIGGYMLELWGIPGPVVEAVTFHHSPSFAKCQDFCPLAAVHIADVLLHRQEGEQYPEVAHLDEMFLQKLGLAARLEQWQTLLPGGSPA